MQFTLSWGRVLVDVCAQAARKKLPCFSAPSFPVHAIRNLLGMPISEGAIGTNCILWWNCRMLLRAAPDGEWISLSADHRRHFVAAMDFAVSKRNADCLLDNVVMA